MVQIQLPEPEKPQLEEERAGREGSEGLLPSTVQEAARSRRPRQQATGNKTSFLLVLISILFAILTVKKICDLKEENIRLWQQLTFERQKDTALKMAVRDNIPATRFLAHRFSSAEVELVTAQGKVDSVPGSSWTINLSVLWSSPTITPCDMHLLSHVLADEIYSQGVERREELEGGSAPWQEDEQEATALEQEATALEQEATALEQEATAQEQEQVSTVLEQELTALEQEVEQEVLATEGEVTEEGEQEEGQVLLLMDENHASVDDEEVSQDRRITETVSAILNGLAEDELYNYDNYYDYKEDVQGDDDQPIVGEDGGDWEEYMEDRGWANDFREEQVELELDNNNASEEY